MVSRQNTKQSSRVKAENFKLRPLAAVVRLAITGGLTLGNAAISHAEGIPIPASVIPGGITAASLPPTALPVPSATFESFGSASATNIGNNTLEINQRSQRAILNYDSFNVGQQSTVRFVQPNESAIALNRVSAASGNPSVILGKIDANGQIYLVNQNGFVFGERSVVNARGIIASALDIDTAAFQGGSNLAQAIVNNQAALSGNNNATITVQGSANSKAKINVGAGGTAILAAQNVDNAGDITGDQNAQIILVASGDRVFLQSATQQADDFTGLLVEVGGQGGQVTNTGNISTRQGNITLAGYAVNQNGRVSSTTSTVTNGSIRLLAREGTTALDGNLRNSPTASTVRSNNPDDVATVSFGPNSVTEILPDTEGLRDDAGTQRNEFADGIPLDDPLTGINEFEAFTAVDSQTQRKSLVQASAHTISVSGAITAPSGNVNFQATNRLPSRAGNGLQAALNGGVDGRGRIILQTGARVDVSGTDNVSAPIERNVVEVFLQGNNLRNSPFQFNGPLRGATVNVDIRDDNPIADVSAAVNGVRRGVAERLSSGGTINFTASGETIVNSGSVIDISGGAITYRDGFINTTKLITINRNLVDISDADPNEQYIGVFGIINEFHQKWLGGTPITYNILASLGGRQFEQGYTEGADAGTLNIVSPFLSFTGDLLAQAINGINQRDNPLRGGRFDYNADLILEANIQAQRASFNTAIINAGSAQSLIIADTLQSDIDPASPAVFDPDSQQTQIRDLILTPAFFQNSGVGTVELTLLGRAKIDSNISLNPTSVFGLNAASIELTENAEIYSPGGDIILSAANLPAYIPLEPVAENLVFSSFDSASQSPLPPLGTINLASASVLDVSGRYVNDFQTSRSTGLTDQALINDPIVIDGGNITLTANSNINFNADFADTANGNVGSGVQIKADGGAHNGVNNVLTAGSGGNISFSAGIVSGDPSSSPYRGGLNFIRRRNQDTELGFEGRISAYGLETNGTLTLNSGTAITIRQPLNGTSADPVNQSDLLVLPTQASIDGNITQFNELDIARNFGFRAITIESQVEVISNFNSSNPVFLIAHNRVLNEGQSLTDPNGYRLQPGSDSIAGFSRLEVLPESLRSPIALNLNADPGRTLNPGSVQLLADSGFRLDKQSTVNIQANRINVDTLIEAPAGSITLTERLPSGVTTTFNEAEGFRGFSVFLGENARLLASGTTRLDLPNTALNRVTGQVLDGGTVSLTANQGYVAIKQGAQIDVSGTSATLDIPVSRSGIGGIAFGKQVIGSDAGEINITAASGVVIDGSLNAQAGSDTNAGGSLNITLNPARFIGTDFSFNTALSALPIGFNIEQNDRILLPDNFTFNASLPANLLGRAVISSQEVSAGGYDELSLVFPYQPLLGSGDAAVPRPQGEIRFIGSVNLSLDNSLTLNSVTLASGLNNAGSAGLAAISSSYLELGSSSFNVVNTTPVIGNGVLDASADYIQLTGALTLNRFAQVSLDSRNDIRLRGLNASADRLAETTVSRREFAGELRTAANVNLNASQIYPTTLSRYRINAITATDGSGNNTGNVVITNTQNLSAATPLSAAGELIIQARNIDQSGVLKAPIGSIELNATETISFNSGSLTSVSAQGQVIPFGAIFGTELIYPLLGINSVNNDTTNLVFNNPSVANSLPLGDKQLLVSAPDIRFNSGSEVDISGGGSLQAVQFLPGGSFADFDYLNPASPSYDGGFAILPGLNSNLAPFDPYLNGGFAASPLATVHLAGTANLPEGDYAILPARYALLPGAFLITPQANSQDLLVNTATPSGLPVVSGYQAIADSNIRDSRLSGFLVESNADVRRRSEYNIQIADEFFTQRSESNGTAIPFLARDAGRIQLGTSAQLVTNLVLQGEFRAAADNARGASLDIAATNINVRDSLIASSPGQLNLVDQDLNNLNLDSVLLGGIRQRDNVTGDTALTVSANNVIIDNNSNLSIPEIVAVAKNQIAINTGAVVNNPRSVNSPDSNYTLEGSNVDSAILRLSGDGQVTVERTFDSINTNATNNNSIVIAQGSVISSSGSVLFDSTLIDLKGNLELEGGALSIATNAINIGDAIPALSAAASLNLSNQTLQNIRVNDLTLASRGAINFYGAIVPLQYNSLVLDAGSISGFSDASGNQATVSISANDITLRHALGTTSVGLLGDGSGSFNLTADTITHGGGNVGLSGFSTVNLNAGNQFSAVSDAGLEVLADLTITTGVLTSGLGQRINIDASGHNVLLSGNPGFEQNLFSGLGGVVTVEAQSIQLDNLKVALPSGVFELTAKTGNITIGGQTEINLSGQAVSFADALDFTPGGTFRATADQGRIQFGSNSIVDVSISEDSTAAGGTFEVSSPEQSIDLAGRIFASGANVLIDSSGSNIDFSAITGSSRPLSSFSLRERNANIIQQASNIIAANSIRLTADLGSIDIFGVLSADNGELNVNGLRQDGGSIVLNAGGKITLASGSRLTATGIEKGGKVLLSSVDSANGGIDIAQGSVIDVRGGTQAPAGQIPGLGGKVVLAAARSQANDDINIQSLAGSIIGAREIYALGVQRYTNADLGNDGQINAAEISDINNQTAAYFNNAEANVASRLGGSVRLQPGIQIDYTGDLVLQENWDFSQQRFGVSGTPVQLTIRASGDFTIASGDDTLSNGLTDGFDAGVLQTGNSASFQVVAGADLQSADALAINNNQAGNLVLQANTSIHTGTGDISLAAAGDFELQAQTATVYNAGRADATDRYGLYGSNVGLNSNVRTSFANAEYPTEGGNIFIHAGRNIIGHTSTQLLNSILGDDSSGQPFYFKIGTEDEGALGQVGLTALPTTYAVDSQQFQQNIGSFGGGKVNISAGENINDLSVLLPNTGKQVGTIDAQGNATSRLDIRGGGVLQVNAGGDIAGGLYYQGSGVGNINAGGAIKGSSRQGDALAFSDGPQLLLSGDNVPLANNFNSDPNRVNTLALNARGDIRISGVTDALLANNGSFLSNFFSYTELSKVSLKSLSGDVHLVNSVSSGKLDSIIGIDANTPAAEGDGSLRAVFPASLDVTAFAGDILLNSDIVLFPSRQSSVAIFAAQAFKTTDDSARNFTLAQPDITPENLPNPLQTLGAFGIQNLFTAERELGAGNGMVAILGATDINQIAAVTINQNGVENIGARREQFYGAPLHVNDTDPSRIVTRSGDISNLQITLSEQAVISAGQDLLNTPIRIQHSSPAGELSQLSQGSAISAGRDIRFTTSISGDGRLNPADSQLIQIAGSGEVFFTTGRNLDLGSSLGIRTTGNLTNRFLTNSGAGLTFLVGLNQNTPDYAGFINSYLLGNPLYTTQLNEITPLITDFVRERLGQPQLTDQEALSVFASFSANELGELQPRINRLINQVFFDVIRTAGSNSAETGDPAFNELAYTAIDTLFPAADYAGNLSLFFSQIQTSLGGDINLLVPGGSVNAGLAVDPSGTGRPASRLGIVVQDVGSINAFVREDFIVNTSRVFTLNGGDILIWSSFGDIDAGRGARSALSADVTIPPLDANGVQPPPIVNVTSGSGIRTASRPGVRQGDVFLFAPQGVIDAGEAGIAGNNITVFGTAILGAGGFQASGQSTGVPTAPTSVVAGLTGTSNSTANTTQSADQLAGLDEASQAASKSTAALGLLSVDFLGFGE